MFRRLKYYGHFLMSLAGINLRLLWGVWKLTKLRPPAITVFGGARIKSDSNHAQLASALAKKLVSHGYSIITGGGPGIMEAANAGAMEYIKECKLDNPKACNMLVSAGIGLLQLNEENDNSYIQEHIVMDYFFTRKWLLVRYSQGFVVFPGGFGTMDELFEIVTLRQTNKMQQAPIVLIDREFWKPIIQWRDDCALKNGLIDESDLALFTVVDTVEEAFCFINQDLCMLKK